MSFPLVSSPWTLPNWLVTHIVIHTCHSRFDHPPLGFDRKWSIFISANPHEPLAFSQGTDWTNSPSMEACRELCAQMVSCNWAVWNGWEFRWKIRIFSRELIGDLMVMKWDFMEIWLENRWKIWIWRDFMGINNMQWWDWMGSKSETWKYPETSSSSVLQNLNASKIILQGGAP